MLVVLAVGVEVIDRLKVLLMVVKFKLTVFWFSDAVLLKLKSSEPLWVSWLKPCDNCWQRAVTESAGVTCKFTIFTVIPIIVYMNSVILARLNSIYLT